MNTIEESQNEKRYGHPDNEEASKYLHTILTIYKEKVDGIYNDEMDII